MQIVTNEFAKAMGSCPYIARITLDGVDVIQGQAVQEIFFRGGSNSSEDSILLGSTFAGSVEITLDREKVTCAIEGRELFVELGIDLEAGTDWIPMGVYTAQNPSEADGVLTVTALDALSAKFDVDYEPMEGFDFNSADGVPSIGFLAALCQRRGVEVDVGGLDPVYLKGAPNGFTERQIIGFISALYGGFANIDRLGVLRIRNYAAVSAAISPDNYYEDGLEKATFNFTAGWLKCHNEAAGLTLFVGDFDAQQGINLESIWMNQAILNGLWEKLEGFSYRPVPELSFLGNPLLDPGDILMLEDAAGEKAAVPVMTVSHEFDGGIRTSIAAYGQAKTEDYQGPTRRAVFRSAENAKNEAVKHADEENKKLNQLELLKRLTNEWVDDGIYLTEDGKLAINASAILTGVLSAALLRAGILQSNDGETFYLDLDNGILKGKFNELSIAGKTVDEIAGTVAQEAVDAQTQADIFRKLTNNGTVQGFYIQDGKLYINAEFVKIINLIADKLESSDGSSVLKITGAALRMLGGSKEAVTLYNSPASDGSVWPILYMHDYTDGVRTDSTEISPHHIKIGGDSFYPAFSVSKRKSTNTTSGVQTSWSEMEVDSINPGKKTLYTGSVAVGESFELPETFTSRYDLFAIKLGTDSGKSPSVVLAYKYGSAIYGVGGWCGTNTETKELYFVSITKSGDTWTLVDAGVHDVLIGGSISAGTRLQLKEVIGVI